MSDKTTRIVSPDLSDGALARREKYLMSSFHSVQIRFVPFKLFAVFTKSPLCGPLDSCSLRADCSAAYSSLGACSSRHSGRQFCCRRLWSFISIGGTRLQSKAFQAAESNPDSRPVSRNTTTSPMGLAHHRERVQFGGLKWEICGGFLKCQWNQGSCHIDKSEAKHYSKERKNIDYCHYRNVVVCDGVQKVLGECGQKCPNKAF